MNQQYYNYNNLTHYLELQGLNYDAQWIRWVKDIINTKITMFGYKNCEKYGLTNEIMEKALMFNNYLCGYKSPNMGFVICRWRPNSIYNLYWKPTHVTLLTLSGREIAWNVPYEDIVLFRDNPMDIIPFLTLNSYIETIIAKEKTLDSIFDWLSLPVVISGSKEQATELKNLTKKSKCREPFVIGTKGFHDHVEMFDIKLPVELEDVYTIIKKYKGMCLASMGIYEVDEKRERIVTSEIEAQNDYVDFVYTGMYNERKRFCEEIKKKWGIEMTVVETYMENFKDNVKMQEQKAMASDSGKIEIAEIKAEGEVEAAKVGGNNNA